MSTTKYFVGDIDKKISMYLGFDISAIDTAKIFYRKPNGVAGYWSAIKGSDNLSIEHSLSVSDLDVPGLWRLQSYVQVLGSTGRNVNQLMLVNPKMETTYIPPEQAVIPTEGTLEIIFTDKLFTCDGLTGVFSLNTKAKTGSLTLYLNGILLASGTEYTLGTDGRTITINSIPDSGWKVYAHYAEDSSTSNFTLKTFTCDGSSKTYILDTEAGDKSTYVYLNGILMIENIDYMIGTDYKTITTTNVLDSGAQLFVYYVERD